MIDFGRALNSYLFPTFQILKSKKYAKKQRKNLYKYYRFSNSTKMSILIRKFHLILIQNFHLRQLKSSIKSMFSFTLHSSNTILPPNSYKSQHNIFIHINTNSLILTRNQSDLFHIFRNFIYKKEKYYT